jgi:hypothetical protein
VQPARLIAGSGSLPVMNHDAERAAESPGWHVASAQAGRCAAPWPRRHLTHAAPRPAPPRRAQVTRHPAQRPPQTELQPPVDLALAPAWVYMHGKGMAPAAAASAPPVVAPRQAALPGDELGQGAETPARALACPWGGGGASCGRPQPCPAPALPGLAQAIWCCAQGVADAAAWPAAGGFSYSAAAQVAQAAPSALPDPGPPAGAQVGPAGLAGAAAGGAGAAGGPGIVMVSYVVANDD